MIKARNKLARTVRETETTKIELAKGRAEMMKSAVACSLQHQERVTIDQVVSEVEVSGRGKLCARVHDGVMFTNVWVEPTKLVLWINKTIREKVNKGTIIGSASAVSMPAVPVFEITIVDEERFKQEDKVPYAQAMQSDKKEAWRKYGSCGRRVEANEPTDRCAQCVKDLEAAEKIVKSAECFIEIEKATMRCTASSIKCPCG